MFADAVNSTSVHCHLIGGFLCQVKDAVAHVMSSLGPIDILVNNAGVMYYTLMRNCHEQEWEHQIDVNCKVT